MGVKRPLDQEDLPELSFKQPKELDNNIKLAFATQNFPTQGTALRVYSPGESKTTIGEPQFDGMCENGNVDRASKMEKEMEASAPLSLVSSGSISSESEEDADNEDASFFYSLPRYIDFSIPWQPPEQFEDPYITVMNSTPRKLVPVGPDYQAEVPEWDPRASSQDSNSLSSNDREQILMGTRVIPMPRPNDSSIDGFAVVGCGRTDCSCPDVGSMRCVQQHVKEAREKLLETIGEEAFAKLGFYDMGEEVASKWTVEDERVFHGVVFSNPASHGRDFWKLLSTVFPNRTKKEIVSYYFNVFMLRRRAVQNRSYMPQIDSDDDEEHNGDYGHYHPKEGSSLLDRDSDGEDDVKLNHGDFYVVGGQEDDDSIVEPFGDQDLDVGWVDDYGSEPENACGDEDSGKNDGILDGDVSKQDDGEMDGGRDIVSGVETKK